MQNREAKGLKVESTLVNKAFFLKSKKELQGNCLSNDFDLNCIIDLFKTAGQGVK